MKNNNIRCALISLNPFPIGNVGTIRYSTYLKAMAKKGYFVKVLIPAPSRTAAPNKNKSGIHDEVHYQYMSEITWVKYPNTFIKIYYLILGMIRSVKYIRKDKINCIILYGDSGLFSFFYWIITRIFAIAYIVDKSEYPYGYSKMSTIKKRIVTLKYRLFDGFIIMTEELIQFYSKVKLKNALLFHLPMTIDSDKFKNINVIEIEKPYIAVVFGVHNRDGLYESIVAYNKYCKLSSTNGYNLMLIGNLEKLPTKDRIMDYIHKERLSDHIIIKGVMPITEMPSILSHAKCLLTTPNEYISGGFPTKLGEYLLASVPIIATNCGEISKYLTDGKELFLLQPGDFDGIAEKILFTQNNPLESKAMAIRGELFCKKLFNADTYSDDLILFLNRIRFKNINQINN